MVPTVVALAAVAAVIGWQVAPRTTDARADAPTRVASTAGPSSPTPSAGPSAQTTPKSKAGGSSGNTTDVAAALRGCRAKVAGADAVLAAAKTGISHWDEHVQAQTDANAGRITVAAMDDVFARTRLVGPDDLARYGKARDAYASADGTCAAVAGAPAADAAALASCRQRATAQREVLVAAEPAMADWKHHLAAMRRSRMQHMDDAQQIWIDAWRAAPPHLNAYAKAAKAFHPPAC